MLWGDPGIGKTSVVSQVAKRAELPLTVVLGTLRDQTDFAGLPVVGPDGTTSLAPPSWARMLADKGEGVLFLDELTCVQPSVQAAMLRVVLEKVVGDLALPSSCWIVAGGNPPESATDGWELAAPVANRFMHLDVEADLAGFEKGMALGWDEAIADMPEPVVPTDADLAAMKAAISTFLHNHPALLHQLPREASSAGRAWASPRTWEMASKVLPRLRSEHRLVALAGLVGAGPATEFMAWLDTADLPDPQRLLAAPKSFGWSKARLDKVYVALSSVVTYVAMQGDPHLWEKAWYVMAAAGSARTADAAAALVPSLQASQPEGAEIPAEALEAFRPLMEAAGLIAPVEVAA